MDDGIALVTLSGECFEAVFERTESTNRDGVLYLFHLNDLKDNRGMRLVSMFRSGQTKLWRKDYDSRIDNVRLNAIRRAFDSRTLSFDLPYEQHAYKEITLQSSEFDSFPAASSDQIKCFIKDRAFWAFKLNTDTRLHVVFDAPLDLEYLGVKAAEVNKYVAFLVDEGFIKGENASGRGRASNKLIKEYEAQSDHEKFQLMAIEESKKSISESDGKPKVGVIVVKDGRVLAKAHRGEYANCHAEYIALENKLANATLAGSTVYTTLEPCTTRNHPKIPCAKRLIDRKVKCVYIGMLDPNPAIQGNGQRLLSNANIETQLFEHKMQMQVQEINREFIRYQEQKGMPKNTMTPPFPIREPMNRKARFRSANEPLGVSLDPMFQFLQRPEEAQPIYLLEGAAMWLRLMPITNTGRTWLIEELRAHAVKLATLPLIPSAGSINYVRSSDGCGYYRDLGDTTTPAVTYIFRSGELWIINAWLSRHHGHFQLEESRFAASLEHCALFLESLGIQAPYQWIVGIEGIEGWFLHPANESRRLGPCMSDVIDASGVYNKGDNVTKLLQAFFESVFDQCGARRPSFV